MRSSLRSLLCVSLAAAACLLLTERFASADTYQFNNATGGDGTWENGPVSGATPWSDGGTQNLPWNNAADNIAEFDGAAGTVDVEGGVTANQMNFKTGGNELLDGSGTITTDSGNQVFTVNANTNLTIDNNLVLDDTNASDRFDISDNGSGTVTLNGNITYTGSENGSPGLIFNGGPDVNYVLTGALSGTPTAAARVLMYGSGSITFGGDYTSSTINELVELDSGTAYISTSKLGTGTIAVGGGGGVNNPSVLTTGAYDVTNTVQASNYAFTDPFTSGNVTLGGTTADLSSFDNVSTTVTGLIFTAVHGGRVVIGAINGNGDVNGLVKTGAGTVVLTQNSNETVYNGFNGKTAPYLSDVRQGTLLFTSTASPSRSAFGTDGGNIQVEAGATLGGSGSTLATQQVLAMAATSVIAPGDPGYQSAAGANISISSATLTLAGGISAANGLTMDFKLDSNDIANSDSIDFGEGAVSIGDVLTINLTSLDGGVNTADTYTLFSGTGDWSGFNPTSVDINAPAGYTATGQFNPGGFNTYTVQFTATPEPSTYAMLLGGLALLGFVGLRRQVSR
jgi:fibronectin-binding autotransporter adhesin